MWLRDGVCILLTLVSACTPPVAPTFAPKSDPARPCGKAPKGARRLVWFQHTARHDSQALDPGRYRFELTHRSYAANCELSVGAADRQTGDVTVPIVTHRSGEIEVRCEGDELGFGSGVESILYLHLPARLRSVRARVTRGRSVIFDGVAAGAEACARASLGSEGICLYLAPDSTLPDSSSDSDQ